MPGGAAEIRALAPDTANRLVQLVEGTMAVADDTEAMGVLLEVAGLERVTRRAEEYLATISAADPDPVAVPDLLLLDENRIRALGERHRPADGAEGPCAECGGAWPCDAYTAAASASPWPRRARTVGARWSAC